MTTNKSNVRYIPIVRIQDTMKEKFPLVRSELASLPLVNTAGNSTVKVERTVRTTTRTVSRSRSVSPCPQTLRVTVISRTPSPQPPEVKVSLEPAAPQPTPIVLRTRSLSPALPVAPRPAPLQHNGTRVVVSPAINSRRRFISRSPSPGYTHTSYSYVPAPVSQPQPPLRPPSIDRFTVSYYTSPATSPAPPFRSPSPSPRPVPRPSPVASPRVLTSYSTMSSDSSRVCLRRLDTSTPWGFRLNGGAEYGQPLYIHKVTARSVAHKAGLQQGDAILAIGDIPANGMTHLAAKSEILRAGNELDFIIQRGVVQLTKLIPAPQPRSQVLTTSAHHWTAPHQDPSVQSRSFILLQKELGVE